MPYLRWHCPACEHAEETPADALPQRLRGAGLLRRVAAEEARDTPYLLELAKGAKEKVLCPACGRAGYVPKIIPEDESEWGGAKKCQRCGAAIAPERLQVLPDAALCSPCQNAQEQGTAGEEEYCPRCGTPMKVRPKRGRGIAGYELACPGCGKH